MSIYHELREIVHAPNLGECDDVFFIHYVHVLIGQHFDVYYENNQVSYHYAGMTRFSGGKMTIFYCRSESAERLKEVNPLTLSRNYWIEKEEMVLIK